MEANNTIYITDWWLSPEVFFFLLVNITPYIEMSKKKVLINEKIENMTRLIDVLNYKANQGVKIYVLIYKEFSFVLSLNSEYTEKILTKFNKNIKVTRYPPVLKTGVFLWADHEKLVIIDDIIGYVGGFDLCWGRYDNNEHPIYEASNKQNIYEFPLIDYSNARIKDFEKVEKYIIESVQREQSVRMPWHDVHSRIIGKAVLNMSQHFIQRWNYANDANNKIEEINQLRALSSIKNNSILKNYPLNLDQILIKINSKEDNNIFNGENLQIENDMKNYVFSEIEIQSKIDINKTNKTELYKKYFT